MQANCIQQCSVKNNSYNNLCNTHTRQGIPVFKGAKEIEAAREIIKNYANTSAVLLMSDLSGSSEPLLTLHCTDMITEISDLYKIKLEKQNAIKFILKELSKNMTEQNRLSVVANMLGLGKFVDSLSGMKFTLRTGENFVQHCEKVQK